MDHKIYNVFRVQMKNVFRTLVYRQVHVNLIGGVMVNVLASGVVDHGFEVRSGQTKDYRKNLYFKFIASPLSTQH